MIKAWRRGIEKKKKDIISNNITKFCPFPLTLNNSLPILFCLEEPPGAAAGVPAGPFHRQQELSRRRSGSLTQPQDRAPCPP